MALEIPKFIGTRVRRREDPALLKGAGKYVADIQLDGMLHLSILRSPLAHARVLSIDAGRARGLLGIVDVLTWKEVRELAPDPLPIMTGSMIGQPDHTATPPRRVLADKVVRFAGDPILAIVSQDPGVGLDALELIDVEYEALAPVMTIAEAIEGGTALHEGVENNCGYRWRFENGDIDSILEKAAHRAEVRIAVQRMIPNAMEPRAIVASYHQSDGQEPGLTVWCTTQIPHLLRDMLAEAIGFPRQNIRLIAPEVGGGFGAKCGIYPEEVLCTALANKLRQPVRWVATRSEDYLATVHGRDQEAHIRLAADSEGRIQALDCDIYADVGAYYSRSAPVIGSITGAMMTGVYDIPAVRCQVQGIFTNKGPIEPYRGAGRPEATYFLERAMDVLALESGIDPAEIRRRNFVQAEDFPYTTAIGLTYDSGEYRRALDTALELVSWTELRREQARRRDDGGNPLGIGIGCYVEVCGFGPWEMGSVRVLEDSTVEVLSGTASQGQGHHTTWAQLTAETLGCPMDRVLVREGDTGLVPKGMGTFGSRSVAVGGVAVLNNALIVRDAARQIAAHLMEAAVEDIELVADRFQVVGAPAHSKTWKEVAQAAYDPSLPEALRQGLHSDELSNQGDLTYPFGTHICAVELDPETGEISILRFLTVDDCGRVINPLIVEGQVHGGIAQGIGQALFEGAEYDTSGNLISGNLMSYALPRAESLPLYETHRTETPSPLNPLGVKGIGEAATIGSIPAVANAVVDALAPWGVRHLDTPLTAEKVWRILNT